MQCKISCRTFRIKKIANDPKNFERTNSKTLNRLKSKLKSYISEHCATISTKNHLANSKTILLYFSSILHVFCGCQSIRQSDNSAFVNIIVIVYSFGRLGTFYFFSKSSDFEIFWTNVAILESASQSIRTKSFRMFTKWSVVIGYANLSFDWSEFYRTKRLTAESTCTPETSTVNSPNCPGTLSSRRPQL